MTAGRLDGRVALVTGGAGAIGAATAERLRADGAVVVTHDLDHADLVGDLADPAEPRRMVDTVVDGWGALDVLVNNAGVEHRAPVGEHTDEAWARVTAINLDAPFRLIREAAPVLGRSTAGAVVNVCSTAVVGFAGQCAYDASKGGLLSLSRSLAVDLGPAGIRVNAVCPGFIDTPMARVGDLGAIAPKFVRGLPVPRMGTPAEVASAISFLAGDDASYITGQALFIDGGWIRS